MWRALTSHGCDQKLVACTAVDPQPAQQKWLDSFFRAKIIAPWAQILPFFSLNTRCAASARGASSEAACCWFTSPSGGILQTTAAFCSERSSRQHSCSGRPGWNGRILSFAAALSESPCAQPFLPVTAVGDGPPPNPRRRGNSRVSCGSFPMWMEAIWGRCACPRFH